MNERIETLVKDFPIQAFQTALIDWFQSEKRDLPWRKNRDPYKVWVSEIMLQQTKVDTVIPYFHRFIDKFPTIEALANADEQDLLKVWEGLGYYSRARNLQTAVREVQASYGGKVPMSKEEFGKLKGVGPYTTGAVLSIAYGIPEPAVDGNVMRVLSRIFCLSDDIAKVKTRTFIEGITREIISEEDPSSFNQGLMELGAMICKPGTPACLLCPVREFCQAYAEGKQSDLPIKSKAKKGNTVHLTAAVLLDSDNRIIICKRPENGLLANLWEFPNEVAVKNGPKNLLSSFETELATKHGIQTHVESPLCTIEHVFSHLKWNIQVYVGKVEGTIEETNELKAVAIEEVTDYPMPVSHQKIWKNYLDGRVTGR
ncbi:A/G-specific adenine glycosylase [Caldibacillus lycopersici]|uniref:Adenine DNA glycosylase n=1 Tax=Perspicuibacillus lycopersici TaxID=1325689 RepID=A0AAE3IW10_9BACI|nr:A/G-specific adenine glycosylase [Perspicuibacillus lycopersici]MCU9614643.1 A/G-specific adenine glycosylase [Perspicuibacillus lycopersici]